MNWGILEVLVVSGFGLLAFIAGDATGVNRGRAQQYKRWRNGYSRRLKKRVLPHLEKLKQEIEAHIIDEGAVSLPPSDSRANVDVSSDLHDFAFETGINVRGGSWRNHCASCEWWSAPREYNGNGDIVIKAERARCEKWDRIMQYGEGCTSWEMWGRVR